MTGAGDRPLVTVLGASGYLGSVLTALLADLPVRLRAVARRPSPVPARTTADVEVRTADLTDATSLAAAVADADVVLHLSKHSGGWRDAEGNPQSEPINVGVMRELVRVMGGRTAAGPPPVVVFAATTSQVGLPPEHPMDGSEPDRPETVYDRQKLAAERMLLAASAEGVLRGVSLRLPTVFGRSPLSAVPDQGVVSTMIRRALAGEPLTMWHDGTVLRDLVPVEDAAGAFLAAMQPARRARRTALAGGHRPPGPAGHGLPDGGGVRRRAHRTATGPGDIGGAARERAGHRFPEHDHRPRTLPARVGMECAHRTAGRCGPHRDRLARRGRDHREGAQCTEVKSPRSTTT